MRDFDPPYVSLASKPGKAPGEQMYSGSRKRTSNLAPSFAPLIIEPVVPQGARCGRGCEDLRPLMSEHGSPFTELATLVKPQSRLRCAEGAGLEERRQLGDHQVGSSAFSGCRSPLYLVQQRYGESET